ncbi:MAG TPA: 3-deoxy-D-manno-octulosonic acid transferase [Thermoanaerobaculia bacterium]|nr:3-deoxy-D-manno-octulosonic acid transferase [Thermoanaerobaculia bacterium]
MFVLYEAILYLVLLFALPWFLVVGVLRGKYLPSVGTRLGRYRGEPSRHDIWFHAVSVGETLALRPIVEEVQRQRPQIAYVITTTTLTGQSLAHRLFPHATITYFPLDFSFSVRRFLDHHLPRVFATIETEIWPNAVRIASSRGIRLILANGRISDRSFPRYRLIRMFVGPILRRYHRILVREQVDRERFERIGATPEKIEVVGNVKFDLELDEADSEVEPLVERLSAGRNIFIAGSTIEGEDEILIPRLGDLLREGSSFAVIAPRKPQRFEIVAALLEASEIRWARRSELSDASALPEADVLLLDTIGELPPLYRHAVAAFVGGSLVAGGGGHNPIEPAAVGVPVAFGPNMSNFREIASTLLEAGAATRVGSVEELLRFVRSMIDDESKRVQLGRRAAETVQRNRGAAARTAQRILELLD